MVIKTTPRRLGRAVTAAARDVLDNAARQGTWDEPPALFLLEERRGQTALLPISIATNTADPVAVLEALGRLFTTGEIAHPPEVGEPVALVLCVETWTRQAPASGPRPQMPASGSLADDPEAYESRIVLAVEAAGGAWVGEHIRGYDPQPVRRASAVTGRLTEALAAALSGMRDAWVGVRS